ncbi:MAG: TonB-dependent receptor [Candidatus Neomarinimicrobiota bacterium]|nr:MAG: TonB-dependent receptor [Candidatus Neomarinimicrobiota bacterium]
MLGAQSGPGTIQGRVTDQKTGDPLIGVNILVKGTYYGASTDENGTYRINQVAVGDYDLEASIIGYKVVLRTGVKVRGPEPVVVDFSMEETVLSLGEEVVVVGKKPLFDVNETSSMARIRSDEITAKVVDDVQDILSEQIGVTTQDNEIHIRGGRIDESLFVVDGMAVKDPLSGMTGNVFVNAEAIEELEVVTGGYNAEYGQAMSGVVNIKLKEGKDHYEGSLKLSSDHWGMTKQVLTNYNTDRIEFNFGGPSFLLERIPRVFGLDLPGRFSMFINGYGKVYDSYLPVAKKLYPHRNWDLPGVSAAQADRIMDWLSPRENNDWHASSKLTWDLNSKKKLNVSYDFSLNINQGYFMPRAFSSTYFPYAYSKILDNYNTITRETRLLNLNWTHTLSTRSFYEVTLGRFVTMEHSAVQDLPWTEYRQRLDLQPINYSFQNSEGDIRITYGDEFYDTGMAPEWYDIWSDSWRMDADWTFRPTERQKVKGGIENSLTTLQVMDIDEPWAGTTGLGSNYDRYRAKTDFGAAYIQDRITFEGMTVNLGVRYDYWFPGKYVENAINNPNSIIITDAAREKFNQETFSFLGYRGKGRLSPRFGISHPVTHNDVLYFYYGHFSQLPTFQYVYAKLNSTAQSTYQVFGNPNLDPKTTVQYELGIKHRFSEDQVLEVKAYWKDMFDYETSESIRPSNPKYSYLTFNMYFNADYARARGIEVILKSRIFRNWYADVNFTYSIVTGKSSNPLDNLLVQAGQLSEKPLGENFMSWDRPLQGFANISYNYKQRWGVSFRFDYTSGRRYTRSIPGTKDYPSGIIEVDGVPYYIGTYEGDKPYFYIAKEPVHNVDMKLFKSFPVGHQKLKLYLEVENLLDARIPRRINPFTGEGYNPGQIYSYSMINRPNPNLDPSRFRRPRSVELGIQYIFK